MSTAALDLLAFGPHPDDVELGCGGLLATLSAAGYRVGVVDLTRGEKASRGTPAIRAQETAEATRILGLAVRENLGLPDTGLSPYTGIDAPDPERAERSQLAAVVAAIRRHRPAVVLAPWSEARHPDHAAASALCTNALFYAGVRRFETAPATERHTGARLLYYPLRHVFEPSFIVDVSDAAERKMAALRCYRSQLERDGSGDETLASSPFTLQVVEARDRFYGAMIGTRCGEPYRSPAALGLRDPVAFFRQNAFEAPHIFPARGGA